MASLTKRRYPDGRLSKHWVITGYDAHSKRVRITTKTSDKVTALRILREFEIRVAEELAGLRPLRPSQSAVPVLSAFGEEYRYYMTNRPPQSQKATTTITLEMVALKQFIRLVGDLPLSQVTPEIVTCWQLECLTEVSDVSVNIEHRSLRVIFNVAKGLGYVMENPFTRVPVVKPA